MIDRLYSIPQKAPSPCKNLAPTSYHISHNSTLQMFLPYLVFLWLHAVTGTQGISFWANNDLTNHFSVKYRCDYMLIYSQNRASGAQNILVGCSFKNCLIRWSVCFKIMIIWCASVMGPQAMHTLIRRFCSYVNNFLLLIEIMVTWRVVGKTTPAGWGSVNDKRTAPYCTRGM